MAYICICVVKLKHKDESVVTLPIDELIEKADGFAGVFPSYYFLKINLWILSQLVCTCILHVLCVGGVVSYISGCDVDLFHTIFKNS
jgi:hypothetical protein